MAIPSVNNVKSFNYNSNAVSDYTVGNGNNKILVIANANEGSESTTSRISWGATDLDKVLEVQYPTSGFLNSLSIWCLPDPPSDTRAITGDVDNRDLLVGAFYLTGADTSNFPEKTKTGVSGTSPNTISIDPLSSDSLVISGFSQGYPDNHALSGVDSTLVDAGGGDLSARLLLGETGLASGQATVECSLVSGQWNRSAGALVSFAPAKQDTTYIVSGTVTDSGGTAIDGATVTLDNVQGANAQSTTTDSNGDYSLSVTVSDSDLPDTWDVTADASGFTAKTKQVSASTSSTSYTTDFSLGGAADTVSPGTGTALADGFAPTITATANTVSLGTAQAAAQGFSATITATQNTVSAGTAQATAQGFEPAITTGSNTVAATTGQAAAQGFDPTISEGAAGDTLVADLGTAKAQGFAPSISTNPATVTLGLGQAASNGFDPDVVADPSEINTGQGQAAATGFDPTITTNARTVVPQLGEAQAQGFEPAVVDGTVGVATTMEIEARPLYEIDVEAKPLYRIRLFVKEQLP